MAVLTGTRQKRTAWIEWLDHCRGGKFTNQLFFGKTIGGVPDVWADGIVALEMALGAGGYTPRSAWAYNFRGIGGAACTCSNFGRCSLHGNGIAIDIDPRLNPLIRTSTFRWSDTAFTPEQIAFVEGIDNAKGEQLWSWGGRWGSIKDYMHFEANVDPGSTDVDWTTVPGETEDPIPTPGEDLMLPLNKGDRSEDIRLAKDRMNETYRTGLDLEGGNPKGALYDQALVDACKDHLIKYTGDKRGVVINANMWNGLLRDFIVKVAPEASPSGGLSEAEVKTLIADTKLVP